MARLLQSLKKFSYRATRSDGSSCSGVIEAFTQNAAIYKLEAQGLSPIVVAQKKSGIIRSYLARCKSYVKRS